MLAHRSADAGSILFSEPKDPVMATTDKAKNTAQRAKGKVKEAAGTVTGNDKLRKEGKADQRKGNLKQAGEKVKGAFKK
jgi:uncharacterized protein YjbJ (UPF0337 family)